MHRRIALLFVALVTACGGSPSSGTTENADLSATSGGERPHAHRARNTDDLFAHSRELLPAEADFIGRLVALTADVRGLPVLHPVVTRIASAPNISRHLVSTIEDEDIVDLVDLYVAIGMLEPGTDVVAILARVVGEQVVGFYDPELDVLVIRDDVVSALANHGEIDPEALVTIAHEVVHALQGQHLELRARMDEENDTDVDDAYQALVEGDATLGMLVVASRISHVPVQQLLDSVSAELDFAATGIAGPESAELSSAPPIIRIGMTAPYIAGLHFCAELFHRDGYAGVDGAHHRRPASTEQVMHPEKYLANEVPDRVVLGSLPAIVAAGYVEVREDTLGELETGIYLGRGEAGGIDVEAGAGWGGDRIRLYRRAGSLAAVYVVSFDTEQDALEAETAAHHADALDHERLVARTGRVLLIAHGFDAALAGTLRALGSDVATQLEAGAR